jgi:hypothetical protein
MKQTQDLSHNKNSLLEVAVGQGVYTWNDYNNNRIQELQEFEVAFYRSSKIHQSLST